MRFFLIFLLLVLSGLSLAAAQQPFQQPPFQQQSFQQRPGMQPQLGMPQGMNQQAYAAQAQVFPKLPPSRACTTVDLPGIWKLQTVYERPVAQDMTDFLVNPVQYLLFNVNDTYGKYLSGRKEVAPGVVRDAIAKQPMLQQYILDPSGFVFFYQNKQAIDTQACFIVATQQGSFNPGQMLLMPPEGQSKERLLKVYTKINERPRPNNGRKR